MEAFSHFPLTLGNLALFGQNATETLCKDFVFNQGGSSVHALWTYPLNAIVTLATIPLMPLLSLISLVAAAVFKLIDCCAAKDSEIEWSERACCALKISFQGIVIGIGVTFAKIFYPPAFDEMLSQLAANHGH